MTCKCHSNDPPAISPTTQCIACAYKHYVQALAAYNEYGYSDNNRDFIAGELRMIVLHTYRRWESIAALAREGALAIAEGRWDEAGMDRIGALVREAYDREYPEIRQRCDRLQHQQQQQDTGD